MQVETPPAEKLYENPEGERRGLVIVNTGDGPPQAGQRPLGGQEPQATWGPMLEGLGDGFSWKSQDLAHSAQLARDGRHRDRDGHGQTCVQGRHSGPAWQSIARSPATQANWETT